jgi:hypothetical protein
MQGAVKGFLWSKKLEAVYSVKEAGDICDGDRPTTKYKIYTYYPTINADLHAKKVLTTSFICLCY